jgi:hypothetical protein
VPVVDAQRHPVAEGRLAHRHGLPQDLGHLRSCDRQARQPDERRRQLDVGLGRGRVRADGEEDPADVLRTHRVRRGTRLDRDGSALTSGQRDHPTNPVAVGQPRQLAAQLRTILHGHEAHQRLAQQLRQVEADERCCRGVGGADHGGEVGGDDRHREHLQHPLVLPPQELLALGEPTDLLLLRPHLLVGHPQLLVRRLQLGEHRLGLR